MPIGVEDFKKLRDKNYYFVDKTYFIQQFLDNHGDVTLITRPRRFGKTLTLSMMDWFFSIQKQKESKGLFDALAISRAGEEYMGQQGQHPVIFFSLKDIKNIAWKSWAEMLDYIRVSFSFSFAEYQDVIENCTLAGEKRLLVRVLSQEASVNELSLSLVSLMRAMQSYYGKKVILLLDEYDVPIQQAWEGGYYEPCIGFMRQFLSPALKTNDSLDFAILTGVLRVAKESIFSGLNNFKLCSILDGRYSDVFGFTAEETENLLAKLHLSDKMLEVQSWYDGYRIGGQEMYNPWSVLNYIDNDCMPRPYWVRTSENGILKSLLENPNPLQITALQDLVEKKTIEVTLNESIVYPDIQADASALFTLLLTTGYLTVVKVMPELDDRYLLRIPNLEIRKLYHTEILDYIVQGAHKNVFDNLFIFLLKGDAERFSWQLKDILQKFVSTWDTANKESFYHGFMLGMSVLFLNQDYVVESNRESGYGRFDLAIFPKDATKSGVIMEFKAAVREDELENKAQDALQQIADKKYDTEFTKRGIRKVWKYGIAFYGKQVCVMRGAVQ